MAKKENNVQVTKIIKPTVKLNSLFNDILDNISFNTYGTDAKRNKEIKKLNSDIDSIINKEIQGLTKFTGDDISTYLVKLFNEYDNRTMTNIKGIEDIFSNDSNGLYEFFNERYKNKNLLYDDLNLICSQLYELQEAIMATRDAIVTSDDMTQRISRSLKFNNSTQDDDKSFIQIVENIEKKFKLHQKIKNHIIPKSLQYGNYYVYTVPYSKLFENYNRSKKDKLMSTTLESTIDENFIKTFKEEHSISLADANLQKKIKEYVKDIEISTDELPIPILEGFTLEDIVKESSFYESDFGSKEFKDEIKSALKNKNQSTKNLFADGTIGSKSPKDEDFSSVRGCYVKLIEPSKMIPIKILDQTIGYYYIHGSNLKTEKSPFSTSITFNQNKNANQDIETSFIGKIADKIVKAFNKSYLEENIKFKELIMNALLFNDIYKKQIRFQFIPIDYITEFPVNEDENGEGTSILKPSLFYAKLYLALLIFKMITIISKSNDTKIYYVKNSGIDQDVVDKVQDVARKIKSRQINFLELLNYNSMISKVGQSREIFMPVGRSGERSIDFDILAGQDVQLNTDLMEMLRTAFINGTGVPSVIMNYINEADYARTLVMANSKFVGRVVNHQLDYNESITELYKKIMTYSTDIPKEIIESFVYLLSTPRFVNNMNMGDLISNTEQTLNFMIKSITGENSSPSEDDNRLKDLLYRELSREIMPMLPWDKLEEFKKKSRMELEKIKLEKSKDDQDQM